MIMQVIYIILIGYLLLYKLDFLILKINVLQIVVCVLNNLTVGCFSCQEHMIFIFKKFPRETNDSQ